MCRTAATAAVTAGSSSSAGNSNSSGNGRTASSSAAGRVRGSYTLFCGSSTYSRMFGHLRFSPPFAPVTMTDVLACDRKRMFLLVFLSRYSPSSFFPSSPPSTHPSASLHSGHTGGGSGGRRHRLVYCYSLLKDLCAAAASSPASASSLLLSVVPQDDSLAAVEVSSRLAR